LEKGKFCSDALERGTCLWKGVADFDGVDRIGAYVYNANEQEYITKVDKRKDWDICTLDQTTRISKFENLLRICSSELTSCRDLDGCTCSRELVGVKLLRSSSPNNCLDDKVSLLPFLNCGVIFAQDTQRRCLQERGERKEKVFWVSGAKNAKTRQLIGP
jgi:hypothetical protein